jgi:regulator of replication initiation timing
MSQVTSEYLLQIIGEIVVENKLLRQEITKLQEYISKDKETIDEKKE